MVQPWAQSARMGSATPQSATFCLDGEDFLFTPKDRKAFIKSHSSILVKRLAAESQAESQVSDSDIRHLRVGAAVLALGCSEELQGPFYHQVLSSCLIPAGLLQLLACGPHIRVYAPKLHDATNYMAPWGTGTGGPLCCFSS